MPDRSLPKDISKFIVPGPRRHITDCKMLGLKNLDKQALGGVQCSTIHHVFGRNCHIATSKRKIRFGDKCIYFSRINPPTHKLTHTPTMVQGRLI